MEILQGHYGTLQFLLRHFHLTRLSLSLPRSIDRQGSYIRKLEEGKSSRNKRREKQTENTRGGRAHPNEQRKLQTLQLQIVVQEKKNPKISLLEFRNANHQTLAVVTANPNEWPQEPRSSVKP